MFADGLVLFLKVHKFEIEKLTVNPSLPKDGTRLSVGGLSSSIQSMRCNNNVLWLNGLSRI